MCVLNEAIIRKREKECEGSRKSLQVEVEAKWSLHPVLCSSIFFIYIYIFIYFIF